MAGDQPTQREGHGAARVTLERLLMADMAAYGIFYVGLKISDYLGWLS